MLTKTQSFSTTQYLINQYYKTTKLDDLGSISGCLRLWDNKTADPALMEDWEDSLKVVIPDYQSEQLITPNQAYAIAKEFLELWQRIGFSEEVQQLLDRMQLNPDGQIIDPEINDIWQKSLKLAITEGPMYFQLLPK